MRKNKIPYTQWTKDFEYGNIACFENPIKAGNLGEWNGLIESDQFDLFFLTNKIAIHLGTNLEWVRVKLPYKVLKLSTRVEPNLNMIFSGQ